MKKSVLTLLVMLLSVSAGFGQMSDIKETITGKEKGIYEALKKGDMDTIKEAFADEIMTVYDSGIHGRQQELSDMMKMKMSSYELSDIKVMQPADNVAIIAYALHAEGTYMDEDFSGDFYATSTWVKMSGEWRAVAHAETTAQSEEQDMDD